MCSQLGYRPRCDDIMCELLFIRKAVKVWWAYKHIENDHSHFFVVIPQQQSGQSKPKIWMRYEKKRYTSA